MRGETITSQGYLVLGFSCVFFTNAKCPKTVGGESWRIPYAYSSKAFIPGEYLNGIHTVDFLIWRFPNQCRIPNAYSAKFVIKPFIDSFLVGFARIRVWYSALVRKPHHKCQFSDFANMRNALQSRRMPYAHSALIW